MRLTIEFLPGFEKVLRIAVRNETESFSFVGVLVADDFGLDEGGITSVGKGGGKEVVGESWIEITDEESKVFWLRETNSSQFWAK